MRPIHQTAKAIAMTSQTFPAVRRVFLVTGKDDQNQKTDPAASAGGTQNIASNNRAKA